MERKDRPSFDQDMENGERIEPPPAEQLKASAVRFLEEGKEQDAASLLSMCSLSIEVFGWDWDAGSQRTLLDVEVTGPRVAYETLSDEHHPVTTSIRRALEALIPGDAQIYRFIPRAELVEPARAKPVRPDIKERREHVKELYEKGLTQEQIARQVPCSKETVKRDLAALRESGKL